jgi:Flp pilus assembly protein TadG
MERVKETIRRSGRGQGVVEMALALFILAFLLLGIVDFGRAFHHYIVVTNASREGARIAARLPDPDDDPDEFVPAVEEATKSEASNSNVDLTPPGASITIVGTRTSGDPISVSVTYTYTTIIGGLIGLPEFPMRAATEMRYQPKN